jgi:hypothetical protein
MLLRIKLTPTLKTLSLVNFYIWSIYLGYVWLYYEFIAYELRSVRSVGWFGFEHKNNPNRETKIYAVCFRWFLKSHPNQTKPNQTNAVRVDSVCAVIAI